MINVMHVYDTSLYLPRALNALPPNSPFVPSKTDDGFFVGGHLLAVVIG